MTSVRMIRWWLCAVLCVRSIASVAISVAVAKPKLVSVPQMSLSIVLGIVSTVRPASCRRSAFFAEPPPPITMTPSMPSRSQFSTTVAVMSLTSPSIVIRCTLSRLVPRIVPPTVRIPDSARRPGGWSGCSPGR